MICKVPGCDFTVRSKSLCNKHYRRKLKYGTTKLNIPSYDHRMMNRGEWDRILVMEQISDIALNYLVGSTGAWREHCDRFKRRRAKRVELVCKKTLTQQCFYYRKAAFIQMGQS